MSMSMSRSNYATLRTMNFSAKALRLSNHVLHPLLPPPSTASQHYNMLERTHSLQPPEHSAHLSDCNFITHTLYKNTYYAFYSGTVSSLDWTGNTILLYL